MGLSFYDDGSMIESIVESLDFASESKLPNLTTVTGDDGIQGLNDDGIQESGDIELVDR